MKKKDTSHRRFRRYRTRTSTTRAYRPNSKRRTLVATMRRHRQRKDIKSVQETFDVLQNITNILAEGRITFWCTARRTAATRRRRWRLCKSMVADNVIPDVTTPWVLLAFCKSGRVKEAFDWLQMHCLGVPSSSLGHGGEDSDNKSGWEVHLKAPGEAVQLSEILMSKMRMQIFPMISIVIQRHRDRCTNRHHRRLCRQNYSPLC